MVLMKDQTMGLLSLSPLYDWARKHDYEMLDEHIVIEGIPVQFLPAYSNLITEAVENANQVELFGVQTFVMKPEYLMAIMFDTFRPKDRERPVKFFDEEKYSPELLKLLIGKYNLQKRYKEFRTRYDE